MTRHAPPPPHATRRGPLRLAALAELPEGACKGFAAGELGLPVAIFLVRRGPRVYGYVNSCPHTGIPLEWLPHAFLDPAGELIQCKTHGALFRVEDGYCVAGPCAGRALRPCDVRVVDGAVYLTAPPPPPFP